MGKTIAILLSVTFLAILAPGTDARSARAVGNPEAGRTLALRACTGCHHVAPDQPFAPLLAGPPDFHTIANRPAATAASLRRFLSSLRVAPPPGHMAQPELTDAQIDDIAAFIMTLHGRH